MNEWKDKRVLIAGRGVSGAGAYDALTKAGATCVFYDGDDTAAQEFAPDTVVVSPGIPEDAPVFALAERLGAPTLGEFELGARLNEKPVVAVTGTNGKTTVTKLIGQMLTNAGMRVAVCGNVGESFARVAACGGYDVAVTEVSSFQLLSAVSFRPHVAVITNISPDHLDRHKTVQAYCAAKRRIAQCQTEEDFLILSQDDIPLYALEDFMPRAQTLYTSVRGRLRGAYVLQDKIYWCGEYICDTDRVRMEGEHNLKNALSAVCAAKAMGVENAPIVDALTSFLPDAHRIELVAHKNGKNYYNDSKGTNISAALAAANAMCGSTCMLVGGSDKGYEYDDLFRRLPPNVVRVAAVGETAQKVKDAAARCGFAAVRAFSDFSEAFNWAADGEEENVLLSPASASFDMFSSYRERGEAFVRLVKNAGKE